MCVQCHLLETSTAWSRRQLLPLQLVPRAQNHEGFRQEKVLDQVRREVTGGCRHAPPCLGLSPCGSKGEVRGRRKEDQSKCQPRKCPRAPSAVSGVCFQEQTRQMLAGSTGPAGWEEGPAGVGGQADGVKGGAHRLLWGVGGCGPSPPQGQGPGCSLLSRADGPEAHGGIRVPGALLSFCRTESAS